MNVPLNTSWCSSFLICTLLISTEPWARLMANDWSSHCICIHVLNNGPVISSLSKAQLICYFICVRARRCAELVAFCQYWWRQPPPPPLLLLFNTRFSPDSNLCNYVCRLKNAPQSGLMLLWSLAWVVLAMCYLLEMLVMQLQLLFAHTTALLKGDFVRWCVYLKRERECSPASLCCTRSMFFFFASFVLSDRQ